MQPLSLLFDITTRMELDRQAQEAVDKGEPIPEWRDRATTKTGTLLDKLYN
jgi:hypothetical protein